LSEPANRRWRLPPRLLLVVSVVYLALIFGFMLWRGISIEPQWVVLALMLIAVAMGRGTQFIKDWAPFLVLFFAYETMRGFAANSGIPPHDVSGLERALFGGTLPTVWLQQHFYDARVISWQDWVGMFFYFMHFPLPVVVGFVFWTRSREHYWRYISAMLLMSFIAFFTYLVYPTAPPWYEFKHSVPPVVKINNETIAKWGVAYYISPLYTSLNPNPFAAFPSLHAAYPALAAMYAWRRYRWISIALLGWTACVWLAIVYLGEHYFVDALAGLGYAVVAALIVEAVARRVRPPKPA
jgi:membrane-associated phospholipid phosphatase